MSLTVRQREILERMAANSDDDEEGEIVMEGLVAYIGLDRTSPKLVMNLVRLCAISLAAGCEVGGYERYHINGTGLYLIGKGPRPEGHEKLFPRKAPQ